MAYDDPEFNEDDLYDQFPKGEDDGNGHEQGFNSWTKLNNPELFTEEARNDPVIRAFLEAPFDVTYAQFKSSHRETEYWIHKPFNAMTGKVSGIDGFVDRINEADPRIPTLVINHERTLARKITRALVISDGTSTGQMIHKEAGE
jgi:hypothetical protein